MKTYLTAFLFALALPALSQPLPGYLQQAKRVSVSGTVTAVNASQIVVSNAVTSLSQGSTTTFRRVNGRLTPVEVPGRPVAVTTPCYTYLRGYPAWTQVKVGDKMSISDYCYLVGEGGGVRTVQYWVTTNVVPRKVWR
jgi:hypothetical protein